jgi:DNA-binding winged helix-turn-helix (wHTH) protein
LSIIIIAKSRANFTESTTIKKNRYQIQDLNNNLFDHIKRGDSINLWGLPLVGMSTRLRKMGHEKDTISEEILKIYIDTQEVCESNSTALFHLIFNELAFAINQQTKTPDKPLLAIRKLLNQLTSKDKKVTLIIDSLRDLTFLNEQLLFSIKSLRDRFHGSLNFIFVSERPIINDPHYSNFKSFTDFACHIEYITKPLPRSKKNIIKDIAEKYDIKNISPNEIDDIYTTSGGILGLITAIIRFIEKRKEREIDINTLLNDSILRQRIAFILKTMTPQEIPILKEIAADNYDNFDGLSPYITESGLLENQNIKSSLIKETIKSKKFAKIYSRYNTYNQTQTDQKTNHTTKKSQKHKKGLFIDLKSGEIFRDGKRTDKCLSKTELKIYRYMKQRSKQLITRDEIAKQMWGNAYLEKYSDWAIDKAISRMRKKVEIKSDNPQHIVTIKGKGIKFYP